MVLLARASTANLLVGICIGMTTGASSVRVFAGELTQFRREAASGISRIGLAQGLSALTKAVRHDSPSVMSLMPAAAKKSGALEKRLSIHLAGNYEMVQNRPGYPPCYPPNYQPGRGTG